MKDIVERLRHHAKWVEPDFDIVEPSLIWAAADEIERLRKALEPKKKCADDWLCEPQYRHIKVMDPDGWDRRDFERSWAEEITESEFHHRLMNSTSVSYPLTSNQRGGE